MIEDATEIHVRAERRLGELLAESEKQHGARGIGKPSGVPARNSTHKPPTLAEQGIDKKLSARAQQLAARDLSAPCGSIHSTNAIDQPSDTFAPYPSTSSASSKPSSAAFVLLSTGASLSLLRNTGCTTCHLVVREFPCLRAENDFDLVVQLAGGQPSLDLGQQLAAFAALERDSAGVRGYVGQAAQGGWDPFARDLSYCRVQHDINFICAPASFGATVAGGLDGSCHHAAPVSVGL